MQENKQQNTGRNALTIILPALSLILLIALVLATLHVVSLY